MKVESKSHGLCADVIKAGDGDSGSWRVMSEKKLGGCTNMIGVKGWFTWARGGGGDEKKRAALKRVASGRSIKTA